MTRAGAAWVLRENAAGGRDINPVTQTDAAADLWAEALEGLDPVDCVKAIRTHREQTDAWEWLVPFAVRELAEVLEPAS